MPLANWRAEEIKLTHGGMTMATAAAIKTYTFQTDQAGHIEISDAEAERLSSQPHSE